MIVNQSATLLNTVSGEVTGITTVVTEDLSNVVDLGNEIFDTDNVDKYTKKLVDHVGRVVFVDRVYQGNAPKVLMDAWEFGAVLEKISMDMPNAKDNPMWDLQNGQTYNQDIFYQPEVSAKFYNKRITFEVAMSFTQEQIKSAFSNAEQLNAFISMIYNRIENRLTVDMEALIMRTINNMIGETLHKDFEDGKYGSDSKVRSVNLLQMYNARFPENKVTAETALTNPEFIRFASMTIGMYTKRMKNISTLFNIGGKERFTPEDRLHIVMLNDFTAAAGAYLQSDTFHEQYTALPNADTVAYWQGSGQNYDFSEVSKIHINTASGNEVVASGILAVMFDRDALGVSNLDRLTTTHYNAEGHFTNYFYKFFAGYFNDTNENFVVFYIADPEA